MECVCYSITRRDKNVADAPIRVPGLLDKPGLWKAAQSR
jgi:hypothetical protein